MEQSIPSAARPFTFDQSFDRTAVKTTQDKKAAPSFNEQELALAREEAYEQGFTAGRESTLSEMQQKQNNLLAQMIKLFERVATDIWKIYAQQKQGAADVAVAITRKIVPNYVKKNGVSEITAVIEKAVAEMINEPRLVLRIHDLHFDTISREVDAITARLGYNGKIIVLADGHLGEHDCRLEWADGGMERNVNLTWSEIDRQLARHHASAPPHVTESSTPPSSTSIAV